MSIDIEIEQPPTFLKPWESPKVDKSPPRPAPTKAYSWKEYNPLAKLLYIRDHEEANQELSKLNSTVLGFDLEWKPTFFRGRKENPVALVQLANYDTILLLQISAMEEFPSKLAELLADSNIVKAGVAIQNDAKKLYGDYRVSICNCVDLSLLARTADNARWQGKYNHPLGLARLIESYEYRLLEKGKITRSNWEAVLSEPQQEYASNDAHAGFMLHRKFETLLPLLPDPPERRWYSFDVVYGQLCQPDGTQWHAFNPNYDPGPPPPPRLPREIKASMIINTESNGEPSTNNTYKNDNRSQRYGRPRKPEQNHPALSTSQQSSTVGGEPNPQSLPKKPVHTSRSHQPLCGGAGNRLPLGTTSSSNNRSARGPEAIGQTGNSKRSRRRHPVSQDASTTNNS